jgi:pimeloyl-ACP methyl ester carboxylesterase
MNDVTNMSFTQSHSNASSEYAEGVDYIEAGAGPLVVLVHSSMAGARQWSALTCDLADHALVRAVNLFGYGNTPAWSDTKPPSLDDFAQLVARAVPSGSSDISLVGHSLGGAVAMHAAAHQLNGRVKNLVLIEPSLFSLLDIHARPEPFNEISALAAYTKQCIADQQLEAAAERFIDYWCGSGTWAASSANRRASFVQSIALLPHEWDAVLDAKAPSAESIATLPRQTLVMCSAATSRPSRAIVEVLLDARPDWESVNICEGGHMAPLTHPHIVNPIIRRFLSP